jgi:putative redox protein
MSPDKAMTIRVVRDQTALMRHEVHIGPHQLTVDESPEMGGEGSGPTAHDLYDAALGACKALTVLWYANRRHMRVQGIEVLVTRDATHERVGTYRLWTMLSLTGDLTDAQREDLLRVAQKCPVHKLMTEVKTEIETSLAPGPGQTL